MRKPLAESVVAQMGAERPSMADAEGIEVLSLVEGFASAHVGSSCVLLWRASVNDARFQLQKEAIQYVTSAVPGKASILCVIEPASEPPSQELRAQAGRLLNELAPQISCLAYVIEGSGFRAAMIRGVVSSLELLKRDKAFPTRCVAEVAQGAAYIETQSGQPASLLVQGTSHLRDRLNRERSSLRPSGRQPSMRSS